VLVVLAYYGAYLLRWDADFPPEQLAIFARTLPVVIVIQMLIFLLWGVYRGLWRYIGIDDLLLIIKAVLTGTLLTSIVILALYGFHGRSRAVLLLDVLLLFVFVGGSRVSFRVLHELIVGHANGHPNAIPVLIYGAGDGGELLVREILNNSEHHYVPVGFIDDDARKVGKLLHGHCIFGTHELPDLIRKHSVQEVLISSTKVPESKLDVVRHMGVSLKRMSLRIE
jgi:UDP-GlcNAc:undecaprenyl-phosphate GlcNAc-1-phosphate transferase